MISFNHWFDTLPLNVGTESVIEYYLCMKPSIMFTSNDSEGVALELQVYKTGWLDP